MAKAVNQLIGGVMQIAFLVITVVIGLFAFKYVKNINAQNQQDQQNAADFKKRGLFGSLGDYLLGTGNQSSDTSQTDNAQALADAKAQEQTLVDQVNRSIALQDQLLNDSGKSVGADTTAEQRQHQADNAVEHLAKNPNETFNRTSSNVGIFNLQTPLDLPKPTPSGDVTLQDFAFFRTAPKTAQEAHNIRDEAIKQVEALGFKVPKGTAPITVLTSSPERINRYAAQLEASQERRLGVRKIGQPLPASATIITRQNVAASRFKNLFDSATGIFG